MNDDDLDQLLAERGARWRAEQPPPPVLDTRTLHRRTPPRWTVPLTAAAAVLAVVAGGALLLGTDSDRGAGPGPADPSTTGPDGPLADVVPWLQLDPRHPVLPEREQVWVPAPSYAEGVEPCAPDQLSATSTVKAALGTTYLEVLLGAVGDARCSVEDLPTVRLYDGTEPLDVAVVPRERDDSSWPGPVLVEGDQRAKLALAWSSDWCGAPVRNDRVELGWPQEAGGGVVAVAGFGPSPACSAPGTDTDGGIEVLAFEPEHWEVHEGARTLEPVEIRQVGFVPGQGGGPSTFVVELMATERALSLATCPDATLVEQHSLDDQNELHYSLNCAAVPHRDQQDRPYLPRGVRVRFAVEAMVGEAPGTYYWVLESPRPHKIALTVPGVERPPVDRGYVKVVGKEDANIHLYVSNQSLEEPRVGIRLLVDDGEVADRVFDVESQHTWLPYHFTMSPGVHTVFARGGDGVLFEQELRVPVTGERYAVLEYWHEKGSDPHFVWRVQEVPAAFD